LKEEIQKDGLLSPLIVRRRDNYYEIIDGQRRFESLKQLGWKKVNVEIQKVDDQKARLMVYKLNQIRESYTVEEQAKYFRKLHEEGKMTFYQIGKELSINDQWVLAHINIFKFPEDIQNAVWTGKLGISHIQELEPIIGAGVIDEATKILYEAIDRGLKVQELRESIKDRVAEVEQRRIESAKQAIKELGPIGTIALNLEVPEELERTAQVLRKEAKRKREAALTPREKVEKEREKENQKRKSEEARKHLEEERESRIQEEVTRRTKEIGDTEKLQIEKEAKKKAQEEILNSPQLLQEVAERAREERTEEFADIEKRAREAAEGIAPALAEALMKVEEESKIAKSSQERKLLESYMFLGSIIQSLKNKTLFCAEHGHEEPMLMWSCGTPITKTHEELRVKLGLNK
jgi:ParB/RepB/Spo0J family partition protein